MTIDQAFVDMINRNNFVVLDVETTGKEHYDVICEIAILDADAKVLLHTKVNPLRPISSEASRIHGITDDDVQNSPTWLTVSQSAIEAIKGKDLVIWNAKHERMLFHRSDETANCGHMEWKDIARWHDAMVFYAELWGEPNAKYPNAKWQSLTNAVKQQGIEPGLFHSALGDTFMTLSLCKHIALNPAQAKVFQKPQMGAAAIEEGFITGHIMYVDFRDVTTLSKLNDQGWRVVGISPFAVEPTTGRMTDAKAILIRKL